MLFRSDAIHRGYDKTTERDFSRTGTFFSNYEPITREVAQAMLDDALGFDQFTAPLQKLITAFAAADHPDYIVSSAQPRLIDGKPSKNPRYLQIRTDLEIPRAVYLAEIGRRLYRRVPIGSPLPAPVNAILPGKRHNPPDPEGGVRALAVYNPIHYQELPELFMDFIASLTGKSPSTTGAGSEGALTKGPFNALPPIIDLNNALVSCLATNAACFVTAAGCIGPKYRFDHDISLLVPEVWCRLTPRERDPSYLIANGYLERCEDFEHGGRTVEAGRLGWRITERFVTSFFGRVLSSPRTVFTEDMLRPELQDRDIFADGMDNIVETQRKVAQNYFEDGSIKDACPPLRALLHIMAQGQYQGRGLMDPAVRSLFTREAMLASPWYEARLAAQQRNDRTRAERQVSALSGFLKNPPPGQGPLVAEIRARLARAQKQLERAGTPGYADSLSGTLGTDPLVFG